MPIPTEPVGSLPRPMKLQNALADYDAGKIKHADLEKEQDAACLDSIKRSEATGEPIISDGEQRMSSFATYPLTDTLAGTGLADNLAADGQYFAIFTDGHHRQLPRLTGGPFKYKTYASQYVEKAMKMTTKPLKQAVIAPSMLSLLYPLDSEVKGYTRDEFLSDLVDQCEKDIRGAFKAGAERVSIDFTEGRLACRNDPNNAWTGRKMLSHFIDLNNRVLDRFSAEERKNIGIHTCPGGDCDATHSADVDYAELLPSMFKMNAGYFLMQLVEREGQGARLQALRAAQPRRRQRRGPGLLHRGDQPAKSTRRVRPRRCATHSWRPRSTFPKSVSVRPTIAASRRSASTSSRSTARPTWRATSRSRRSPRGSRERRWRLRNSAWRRSALRPGVGGGAALPRRRPFPRSRRAPFRGPDPHGSAEFRL